MSFLKKGKSVKNYAKNLGQLPYPKGEGLSVRMNETICENCGKVLSQEGEDHSFDRKNESSEVNYPLRKERACP